jgi:hypothetical protein
MVGLLWIIHVEADLLDDVGEVGVSECQVLESPDEGLEVSWISNRRPGRGRDLSPRVHRHRNRLVVHHANSLKNIESKLTLSEEEPVRLILYRDSQKMMEGSEILHGEFPLEGRYGPLQKCYARCGEDNIINVNQQVYHIYATPEDD